MNDLNRIRIRIRGIRIVNNLDNRSNNVNTTDPRSSDCPRNNRNNREIKMIFSLKPFTLLITCLKALNMNRSSIYSKGLENL